MQPSSTSRKQLDTRALKRFQSEAALAAEIAHPNVTRTVEFGHDDHFGKQSDRGRSGNPNRQYLCASDRCRRAQGSSECSVTTAWRSPWGRAREDGDRQRPAATTSSANSALLTNDTPSQPSSRASSHARSPLPTRTPPAAPTSIPTTSLPTREDWK